MSRLVSQWASVHIDSDGGITDYSLMDALAKADLALLHLANSEGIELEPVHCVRVVVEAFVKED